MIHYEVYESNLLRNHPYARFKYVEHANHFCEYLNKHFNEDCFHVRSVATEKDFNIDISDIFKSYCKRRIE